MDFEPIYPKEMPDEIKKYFNWFYAAYGWNPFSGIKCSKCGKVIGLYNVYRCFQCDAPFHKECLIIHCDADRK